MDYKVVNLKTNSSSVEQALAVFEIELDIAKKEGVKLIKFVHGYGSGGVGGVISIAIRKKCFLLKKQKLIKNFMLGNEWDISNQKCFNILIEVKDIYNDEDLNNSNPGITLVLL